MNKILPFALIGIAAIFFLQSNTASGAGTGQFVTINGQRMTIQQANSLGYFYYDGARGGQPGWYHSSQFPGFSQAGAQAGTPQWYNIVNTILQTGSSVFSALQPVFTPSGNQTGAPVPETYSSGVPGSGTQITINGRRPEWVNEIWYGGSKYQAR
jgi:hypothetical protein